MKVIALGGAGDMGRRAVADLALQPEVEEITVADYNNDAARKLAVELGGAPHVAPLRVDANDHSALVNSLLGHDVAFSAIGPFYKFEAKVARAAIEAGVPLVTICDDYDAAEEVLGLDAAAKEKNVTVLTGCGLSPGLSNVLARKAADQLERVDAIHVAWAASASDSKGYAVILHVLHMVTGEVPTYRDGRTALVTAGSEGERLEFPRPLGEVHVSHVGHPEPVTIPRFIEGVRTVTLKGGLSENYLNNLTRWMARARLTDTDSKKDRLGRAINFTLPALKAVGRSKEPMSGIRVDVVGLKDGQETRLVYSAADHMNNLTGVPLAIATLMLGRGQIKDAGVLAPEACIEPDAFLRELRERGISVYEGPELTNLIN
jgi:saccharopine dehydrogenase-like NADP-dependent oxidoreductase